VKRNEQVAAIRRNTSFRIYRERLMVVSIGLIVIINMVKSNDEYTVNAS